MEEKLRDLIINAVAEGIRQGFQSVETVNGKDPNELLDIDQVCEEFHIGKVKARKMFKDPDLPVQRYCKKHRVARGEVQKYMKTRHDYLKEVA